jgi:hypothetical protein
VTGPFGRQGTGWEVVHAARLLISTESSYVNAHKLFLDAGHMAGSCAANLRIPNSPGHCVRRRNAQLSQVSSPKSVIFPGKKT